MIPGIALRDIAEPVLGAFPPMDDRDYKPRNAGTILNILVGLFRNRKRQTNCRFLYFPFSCRQYLYAFPFLRVGSNQPGNVSQLHSPILNIAINVSCRPNKNNRVSGWIALVIFDFIVRNWNLGSYPYVHSTQGLIWSVVSNDGV